MPPDLSRYMHVSYLSVRAWLAGVGSHPLGHDLMYVNDPSSTYTGWACKTCRCYLGIQTAFLMEERYWDVVRHQVQKNPDEVLYSIQQNYRTGLTIWERLLFDVNPLSEASHNDPQG